MANILVEQIRQVTVITINRPAVRNAIDGPTANELAAAFRAFDADDNQLVAVLTGAEGTFCAGADLKGISENRGNKVRDCLLYTSPSPRDGLLSRMPSSA